ncbi:MAG: cytochrome c biogenesis protein CcdA [Myxococcota bacterium]
MRTRFVGPLLAFVAVLLIASPAEADLLGDLAEKFEAALGSGAYGWALALIFLAGLATALTPCVYPMIAITVSVFGARQAKSRTEGALLSLSFILGIAALFTPLGVVSAMTGQGMSEHMGSPYVMVPLAVLFLAMGASMFGFWDMNLPASWQNRLAQVGGAGYKGAFGIGFVNGLIAAPCTGPVLAVLLGYIASTGSPGFGALALFVYSLGLGVLFFFVGTFAVSLPKSGKWLDAVKSVFGIVMVVLAIYYVRTWLPLPKPVVRSTLWWAVPLGLVVFGLVLGAVHLSFKEGGPIVKARKGVGALSVIAGSLGLIFWASALPPGAHIEWMDDYQAAVAAAEETGKPLLVDFGAEWCLACNELEHQAMSDPRIVAESQRFVPVRLDLTRADAPDWPVLRERYEKQGLPFVAMHGEDGEVAHEITGLVSADEFLEMMQSTN